MKEHDMAKITHEIKLIKAKIIAMIFFILTIPTKNYRHATTEHNTFFLKKNGFIFIQKNAFLIMKSNITCYCEQRSFGYSRLAIPLKATNHSLIFVVLTEPKLKPIIRPTTSCNEHSN